MKIEITPSYLPDVNPIDPCFYKSVINGTTIYSCGKTWEEAKANHLAKLEQVINQPPLPPTETIEI